MNYPTLFGLAALSALTIAPTLSFADERCRQLEMLRVKYAAVELTSEQMVVKVKLTAWYLANCGKHELPGARPVTTVSAAAR
jgi:hypothetical protein